MSNVNNPYTNSTKMKDRVPSRPSDIYCNVPCCNCRDKKKSSTTTGQEKKKYTSLLDVSIIHFCQGLTVLVLNDAVLTDSINNYYYSFYF